MNNATVLTLKKCNEKMKLLYQSALNNALLNSKEIPHISEQLFCTTVGCISTSPLSSARIIF